MRNKLFDQSGSVLLEGVTALLILSLTITSLILFAGMMIKGQIETETAYDEAFALNSLRDQIGEKITQLADHSPTTIASTVESIVAGRNGWHFEILSQEKGLLSLLLLHETIEEKHAYRIKIFISP